MRTNGWLAPCHSKLCIIGRGYGFVIEANVQEPSRRGIGHVRLQQNQGRYNTPIPDNYAKRIFVLYRDLVAPGQLKRRLRVLHQELELKSGAFG